MYTIHVSDTQILGTTHTKYQNTRNLKYLNIFNTRNIRISEAPDPTLAKNTTRSVSFVVAFRFLDYSATRTRETRRVWNSQFQCIRNVSVAISEFRKKRSSL